VSPSFVGIYCILLSLLLFSPSRLSFQQRSRGLDKPTSAPGDRAFLFDVYPALLAPPIRVTGSRWPAYGKTLPTQPPLVVGNARTRNSLRRSMIPHIINSHFRVPSFPRALKSSPTGQVSFPLSTSTDTRSTRKHEASWSIFERSRAGSTTSRAKQSVQKKASLLSSQMLCAATWFSFWTSCEGELITSRS
jgi:hypothetical protein